jgi:soluble lytic murein transglycosylase
VKGQGKATDLFRAAAEPGGEAYYQQVAGLRLGLTRAEMEKRLLGTVQEEDTSTPDREVEKVLRAYAEHALFERIYPEWLAVRPWLSADTGFALAKSLQNAPDEEYWVPGLRMAAWYGRGITKERLRLQYPRFYMKEIQHSTAEFALPERLLFGLVRSESYFIREVRSRVQAGGLTQLMPATAATIAKELGISDYDVNDAATNVRFGAYYLAEQIKTRNGSYLEALCAYNAGPHRIRAWRRTNTNPPDLLLETIPFAETRGYCRTNTASTAHYGWLYYDMNPLDVAAEILK